MGGGCWVSQLLLLSLGIPPGVKASSQLSQLPSTGACPHQDQAMGGPNTTWPSSTQLLPQRPTEPHAPTVPIDVGK